MAVDTIHKRIVDARKSLGLKQEDVVGKISKKIAMYRLWEQGKRTPEDGDLYQLAEVLDVRFEWLKTGAGEMRGEDSGETVTLDLDVMPGEMRSEMGFVLGEDGEIERYILIKVIGLTKEEGEERIRRETEGI